MAERDKTLDRRRFFGALGGATSAAVAVAAAPLTATPAAAYDPGPAESKTRYRETEHVKAFYRSSGYETLKK
jgi:hypothetical protein